MHGRSLVVAVTLFATTTAGADDRSDYTKHDWPVQVILRPLTLAPEMVEVAGETFFISLSQDRVLDPIALAPDIYTALTRRISLGITHELGLCLNTVGCSSTYNDVAVSVLGSIVRAGAIDVAARIGISVPQFNEFQLGGIAGLKMRLRTWRVALVVEPIVYVGVFGRASAGNDPGVSEGRNQYVDSNAAIQLQATARAVVFVTTGLRGPTSSFGDNYQIPLGFGGLFALNHRVDLGAELRFENALGADGAVPAGSTIRSLLLRAALRL